VAGGVQAADFTSPGAGYSMTGTVTLIGSGAGVHTGPLDPAAFTSLGANPFTLAGTYSIDTSGPTPVLTRPDTSTVNGVVSDGIAVFTFDDIAIAAGMTVNGVQNAGSRPFALLSQGDLTVNGTVNVSGANGPGGATIHEGGNGGNAGPGGGGGRGGGADQSETGNFGSGGVGFANGGNGSASYSGGNGGSVEPGGGGRGNGLGGAGGAFGGNGGTGYCPPVRLPSPPLLVPMASRWLWQATIPA
jgi:hypothetical protein